MMLRGREMTPVLLDAPQDELHGLIIRIQSGRPLGKLKAALLRLSPTFPRVAAPLVEIRERQPRVAAGELGIDFKGTLKKRSGLLVRGERALLQMLEPAQPRFVSSQRGN